MLDVTALLLDGFTALASTGDHDGVPCTALLLDATGRPWLQVWTGEDDLAGTDTWLLTPHPRGRDLHASAQLEGAWLLEWHWDDTARSHARWLPPGDPVLACTVLPTLAPEQVCAP